MKNPANSPAPQGYSVVCPYLMVASVEKEIEFLAAVFKAQTTEQLKLHDGVIQHGEVRVGETIIMMGRARTEWPSTQNACYIFVSDVDEAYTRALQMGAAPVLEPADRFYGYREGGVKDPQGNTWWMAQVLEQLTEAEMQERLRALGG